MLQRLQDYERLTARTTDVELGRVEDFLFDDKRWDIHHIVVNPGGLFGRAVLVSPFSILEPDWERSLLVTRPIDVSRPGALHHWPPGRTWPEPVDELNGVGDAAVGAGLHTMISLRGIRVHAVDGDIGYADDLIVDDGIWRARYLVVDTSAWAQHSVLLPTQQIIRTDWLGCRAYLDASCALIAGAPSYDPEGPLDHAAEDAFARYYGLPQRVI